MKIHIVLNYLIKYNYTLYLLKFSNCVYILLSCFHNISSFVLILLPYCFHDIFYGSLFVLLGVRLSISCSFLVLLLCFLGISLFVLITALLCFLHAISFLVGLVLLLLMKV